MTRKIQLVLFVCEFVLLFCVCVCGREREGVAALPFSFVWIVDVANRQMGPVPKCAFESLL